MSYTASVKAQIDAEIERLTAMGLTPVNVVLSYTDRWRLSYHDLGGPDVGYPRPGAYRTFVEHYRGLEVICPGLGHSSPPAIGVRP